MAKARIGTTPLPSPPKNDVQETRISGDGGGVDLIKLVKGLFLDGKPVLLPVLEKYFAIRSNTLITIRLGSKDRFFQFSIGSLPRSVIYYMCLLSEIAFIFLYSAFAIAVLLTLLYALLKVVGLADAVSHYMQLVLGHLIK